MRVDADTAAAGGVEEIDLARAGGEIVVGILRVDAAFDRVTARLAVDDVIGKRFARGDADLLLDEVATAHFLGDGMLHLDPGVHLHEVEILLVVDEVFDRAAVLVADVPHEGLGGLGHALAQSGSEERRGRFLDDLLVAALHRAIALAEFLHVAVAVGHDLEFHVVRILDEALDVDIGTAEAGLGLVPGGVEGGDKTRFVQRRAHPAAAPAGGGFDHHRETDLLGDLEGLGLGLDDALGAGSHRNAKFRRGGAGLVLVPHHRDDAGGGTDELHVAALAELGEPRIFGKESVARVDRVDIGDLGGREDRLHVQVGVGAFGGPDADGIVGEMDVHRVHIRLGVDRGGAHPEFFGGANDAQGDFAAVRYENVLEHGVSLGPGPGDRVRKTNKGVGRKIRPSSRGRAVRRIARRCRFRRGVRRSRRRFRI